MICLKEYLTCSICFSFLVPSMSPKQCSNCLRHLYCLPCISRLRGKCSYCRDSQVQFVTIAPQLLNMLQCFSFKCEQDQCGAVMDHQSGAAGAYAYQRHLLFQCVASDLRQTKLGKMKTCPFCKCSFMQFSQSKFHVCDNSLRFNCDKHLKPHFPFNGGTRLSINFLKANQIDSIDKQKDSKDL